VDLRAHAGHGDASYSFTGEGAGTLQSDVDPPRPYCFVCVACVLVAVAVHRCRQTNKGLLLQRAFVLSHARGAPSQPRSIHSTQNIL